MATHDYSLDNQSRSSFRADLNNCLAAILSQNSSATEPTTTSPYMFWADTTNDLLKQRNAVDTAWISLMTLSTGKMLTAAAADSAGTATTATTATNQSGGTVAATTISASGLISANGGQIKFPASQNISADANTLDDYEEGTWTPTIAFGGTVSSGATYVTQTGEYTKIGRLIQVSFFLDLNNKGSGTGPASVAGLPFGCSNMSWFANACYWSGMASNFVTLISSVNAVAQCSLASAATASTTLSLTTNAAFNNNSSIGSSLTYTLS